jgi:hypothetical protein
MAFCSANEKLFNRNLMKYNFLKNVGVEDQFSVSYMCNPNYAKGM